MTVSSTTAGAGTTDTITWLENQNVVRAATPDDCPVPTGGADDQSGPTDSTPPCPDWLHTGDPGADRNTILIVTPGTDDGSLYPRIKGMRAGRQTLVVNYPEAIGPIISGQAEVALPLFAPSYDKSRDIAVANNLTVMVAFEALHGPRVVYTGYSQGAEALGNAAEQAVADGSIDTSRSHVILISDPRSPWGLKAWVAGHPAIGAVLSVFGAESNGSRDPGATGRDLAVTSVIVVGDPVSNFQWVWYRPVSSLLVDAAGFITIHSGAGVDNYGNLIDYSHEPTRLHSRDGNTTYLVYQPDHHPLTMLTMLIDDKLGVTYDADDLERWDKANNAFYPLQEPGVGNAAVPVVASDAGPTARQTNSPTVTQTSDSVAAAAAPSTVGRHRAPEPAVGDNPGTAPAGTGETGTAPTREAPTASSQTQQTPAPQTQTETRQSQRPAEAEQPALGGGRQSTDEGGAATTGGASVPASSPAA
ncbi:PE-PPE domain-containing protein [Gordonia sp. DT30]|uniref:PE-PPE domain-containing protein n=1 Tax=Gordonia sp. DT30 TaxID=3416546 RepID=UPI003CE90874